MDNLQNSVNENTNEEVSFEADTDNMMEEMLRGMLKSYQAAWNKNNEKNEIKYTMTITNHNITTPDGNKAVAYLRLDRSIREKGLAKLIPNPEEGKPDIIDEGWETKLVHQEIYYFRNMKERVDPRALWKEQLYMNAIARLFGAGLEYAELLNRLNPAKEAMAKAAQEPTEEQKTEERLNKLGLTSSTEMPKPLTKEEQDYKEWVKNNNVYGKQ